MSLKTYLGDSVYADFDGYYISLTTENGLPTDPSNVIELEPSVLHSLLIFIKHLNIPEFTDSLYKKD